LLETDKGASRLGEVSLVPHSSPISQSGILFYNILIDENASCHIALGNGIRSTLENGLTMSDEKLSAVGFNVSLLHRDFMIGSEEMDVDGIKEDGTVVSESGYITTAEWQIVDKDHVKVSAWDNGEPGFEFKHQFDEGMLIIRILDEGFAPEGFVQITHWQRPLDVAIIGNWRLEKVVCD